MQLLVTGFSVPLPKHGFSKPENTKFKLSVHFASFSREMEVGEGNFGKLTGRPSWNDSVL